MHVVYVNLYSDGSNLYSTCVIISRRVPYLDVVGVQVQKRKGGEVAEGPWLNVRDVVVAHRQLRQATTGDSWVRLVQETAGSGWDRRQLGQTETGDSWVRLRQETAG